MEPLDLAALWGRSEPLPGGRGTARVCTVEDRRAVVKRESRGGLSRRILPDLFLCTRPFRHELRLMERLHALGLSPEPLGSQFVRRGALFAGFTLVAYAERARSLAQLWKEGHLDAAALARAGRGVARLHRACAVHGDLNAGNLLLTDEGEALFLDLRHSRLRTRPASPAQRSRNLLRLARSLHKIRATAGLQWTDGPFDALAAGYAEGWGEAEPWLDSWVTRCVRGFPFRSLWWRRSR
jgi:tRNA A-37 threonylcarbamoyl transferase component Bud32